ncbi:MAG: glycosyltransferase family 4 protein [Chloroflexi bacterium]|nr:glycosyltransferase family 4 protein [Chloroflexota bacterium]
MRVCHITSAHPQEDTRILYKECCTLSQAGHEVFLLSYGKTYMKFGVHIIGLERRPTRRLARIVSGASRIVKKAIEIDAEVYHLHDPELLPYIPKLKRAGKKVIFDSHEDVPQQILEKEWLLAPRLVSRVYSWLERHYLKKADAVIGVTPYLVERLANINPKAVMVTNYPVLENNGHLKESVSHDKYLCFVGRVASVWEHLSVIEALQEIKDVRYVLCGPVDTPSYLDMLRSKDANGVLDYRGIVTPQERQELYKRALAGICWLKPSPNVSGNYGSLGVNKMFEQMAAGIPIIASDFILWAEIIQRYQCGIVLSSGDIEGLKKAVTFLLENQSEAQQMGLNGRRAVEEEYNWDTQSKTLEDLYEQLL